MDENIEMWENNTLEKTMKTNEEMKNDTPKIYVRWALIGALYGFLVGTAFVLVAAFINVWLYSGLPIGVEWKQALIRWLLIGLGLTLIGALTSLFTETLPSLAAGAIAAGALGLTAAIYPSSSSTAIKFMLFIFLLAPIAVTSLPLIWLLRFLMHQHALSVQMKGSVLRIALLMLAAFSTGALGGYFMKMSRSAMMAVQMVHQNIQAASGNPDSEVNQLPGFKEHTGMKYVLFQKPSTSSTVGYDVRVEYEDGYAIQCVVVTYPGSPPFLRSCEEAP